MNRRRVWTHRILLEQKLHEASSFLTLTYAPERVPLGGSLVPSDLQNFFKRLRGRIPNWPVRYYAVGEYGDHTQRPHYHAALFGVSVHETEVVRDAWGMGHVFLGDLTAESAAYVAGYVTKKLTNPDDPKLNGRYPEFARMSRRPGLGRGAVPVVAAALNTSEGSRLLADSGDVPNALRVGPRTLPLGRYLKGKLREEMGLDDEAVQERRKLFHWKEQLQDVQAHQGNVKEYLKAQESEAAVKRLQMETKHKIKTSGKKL